MKSVTDSPRQDLGAKAVFVAKAIGRRALWAPYDIKHKLGGGDPLDPPRGSPSSVTVTFVTSAAGMCSSSRRLEA